MLQGDLKTAYITLLDKFGQEPFRLPHFVSRTSWLRNYVQS